MIRKPGISLYIVFLIFLVIVLLFGFDGLYGQDAYEYLRYTNRLRDFILNGNPPGDYFWPIGYPLAGALLSLLVQSTNYSLLIISFLSLILVYVYAHKMLVLFFRNETGYEIYLLVFLMLSPLFLRSGMVCMSDMPAAACVTAFFYHSFAFRRSGKKINLLLLFLFGASAFMFRYVVPLLLIVPALLTVRSALKKEYLLSIVSGFVITVLVIAPHFYLRQEHSTQFLNHPWLTDWSPLNFFRSGFQTPDGYLRFRFINILYWFTGFFHPGLFIAGILFFFLLVFRVRKLMAEEKIVLVSAALYLFFLSGMPAQNTRFFIPVLPLLVIASFRGFLVFRNWLKGILQQVFIPAAILLQLVLFAAGFRLIYQRNLFEREVFSWMEKNTRQNVLYSFDLDVALQGRGLKKEFHNLFEKRYDTFERNSLVLFNPQQFEKQWAGKNPMLNWEKIKSDYQPVQIHTFGQGWILYEIR